MRPVVVLGPTASGKSDVAMTAAIAVDGTEIVAVDAMQVYRRMDIGTAKPSAADQALVRHHCLDLVEPSERFTVSDFQAAADRAINDIDGRPLLVAGTGLYLTAVIDRLELPGEWPDIRAELEASDDLAALYQRLTEVDPIAAGRIQPDNRRRIVRALEVCLGSGRLFSSFGPGVGRFPPSDSVQIGLRLDRAVLAERIEQRVNRMIEAGLVGEVECILANTGALSHTARQALGYKELIDHLAGHTSLSEAIATIVLRTRQFSVRQERWFRRDPRVRWIDIEHDPVAEAAPAVIDALLRP
jgi:tRNA dimethylallyltransferase